MYELETSNEQLENSLKPSGLIANSYLLVSKTCGGGVIGWWHKLCTTTGFYTHTYVQQLTSWVQNSVCAQFKHFCSSVLSTPFSQLSPLLLFFYTPFPQPLLLKQLSK